MQCVNLANLCKALVLAHENKPAYADVLSAVSGVLFFGTPHRGSQVAEIGSVVGKIVNLCVRASQMARLTGSMREDLLFTLGLDAQAMNELAESSRNRMENLEVVSFYETQTMQGFSDLIVERSSAIMQIPGEMIIALHANHRSMCRFEGPKDGSCSLALDAIEDVVKSILSSKQLATRVNRVLSIESFTETERSCMILLDSIYLVDYKAQLPKPVQGTCSWVLNNPAFLAWKNTTESDLLWVTGEPGSGKTMISVYLTDYLELDSTTRVKPQVFFFFCDDKIQLQRDPKSILRGIIWQIVRLHRDLIKYVKHRFDQEGPSLASSFSALWELFLKVVSESTSGSVRIIVDALDECETGSRNRLLEAIKRLLDEHRASKLRPQTSIKFLITSRPSFDLPAMTKNRLSIEQNQSSVSGDLRTFIRSKIRDIANRFECDEETKQFLEEALYSRSDQSFLWVNMVLHNLEGSAKASKKAFEQILNIFPGELEDVYASFLRGITDQNRSDARRILRLLIGASRYLTLSEMHVAFIIDQSCKSSNEMKESLLPSIRTTLQIIVGPFIRIKDADQISDDYAKVSLIHQSAKEYLTDFSIRSLDETVQSLAVPEIDAALSMAQSCMQYLLLQDFNSDIFTPESRSGSSEPGTTSAEASLLTDTDTKGAIHLFGPEDDFGLCDSFKETKDIEEEQITSIAQKHALFDYAATHWAEHYAMCESVAPKATLDAARQLTSRSCVMNNWFRYYWAKHNFEYSFPDEFQPIEIAAFFNLTALLTEHLQHECHGEGTLARALFWAARMSSVGSIKLLIRHGADPNSAAIDQQTPLTVSAQYGHLEVVNMLLNDLNTTVTLGGKSGRTALSFAAGNGHVDVVESLLNHGAYEPDDQDYTSWTPFFWAVQGDHADIVRLFLKLKDSPLDINQVDKSGRSALSWAAGEGSRKTMNVIIRESVSVLDVNLKNKEGRSPLLWAVVNKQREAANDLLRIQHVDKATKDNNLQNTISWASQTGDTKVLDLLIQNKCGGEDDVDIDGWTPLLWALFNQSPASYGYLHVVKLLVTWKADLHVKDEGGLTAADFARLGGYTEIYEFLEKIGSQAGSKAESQSEAPGSGKGHV
ncbi:hypothetical protein HBH70_138040 [Parastagonospora nodorum]|nr:hypothetical protein HBI03_137840 [Parastagonospora nodorum]KAH4281917.1 hypothetical protein HBI04_045110 [Parastagonospora nodorum]KAH5111113.1 hypothetical protein HBH72_020880 [Parastagonospora nodorum]KAH5134839.1 hypothetical protein HBH70_138040 [Parastagonospora nodorum]KAH5335968.1 hypothetical protein HBI50_033660 [Parastagonospora nodorum]